MTAPGSPSRWRAAGRLLLLLVGIALTTWGVCLVAFATSMRNTRLGIPIAFWGALLGYAAIRSTSFRGTGGRRVAGVDEADKPSTELELRAAAEVVHERDQAERREYELQLELMLRRELEQGLREELAGLRRDVAELRGDVLDAVDGRLRLERVEITRIIGSNLAALHDDARRLPASSGPAPALTVPAPGDARALSDSPTLSASPKLTETSTLPVSASSPAGTSRAERDDTVRQESKATLRPEWMQTPSTPTTRNGVGDPAVAPRPAFEPPPVQPAVVAAETSARPWTVSTDPEPNSASTSVPTPNAGSAPEPSPAADPAQSADSRAASPDRSTANVRSEPQPEPARVFPPAPPAQPEPKPASRLWEPGPESGNGVSAAEAPGSPIAPGRSPLSDPAPAMSSSDPFAELPRLSTFRLPDLPPGVEEPASTPTSAAASAVPDADEDPIEISAPNRLPDLPPGVEEPASPSTSAAASAPPDAVEDPIEISAPNGYVGRRRQAAEEADATPTRGRHGAAYESDRPARRH